MSKIYALILLLFAIPIKEINAQNAVSKQEYLKSLDARMNAWMEEFIIPGAALAIIEDGEIVLMKGYGFADQVKNKKVTNTTGFNIGSISKTVAAWGVMKLVEEGKIHLDTPVVNYLTRWQFPETEFDESGITVRRLLSHTAGLSLHGYPGWGPEDTLPTIEESLSGKNNGPGDVRLIMEPGTKWSYSGGGYTVLQLLIEEVTGLSFEDYMQKAILSPLGMNNSSYKIDDKIVKASSLEHDGYGEVIPFEYFTAKAAAGFHTTIEDFAKFALATIDNQQQGQKKRVLQPETVALMTTAAPASGGKYGFGYQVMPLSDKKTIVTGHGGDNTGWHALFMVDRAGGDGFIILTNGSSGSHMYRQVMCDWTYWKTGASLGNMCKKPILPLMISTIKHKGIEAALAKYNAEKTADEAEYYFNENQLNILGYELLAKDKVKEAIEIFKLNVSEYPKSSNVYDSLGEAYLKAGNKELALLNYEKSIELDPSNQNAIKIVKELKN